MQHAWRYCLIALMVLATMAMAERPLKSTDELKMAFARDGYEVVKVVEFEGMRGLEAHHKTAVNYETKKPKKAFYVEGNSYQMGYLIGLMAHKDVEVMCVDFTDNIFFDYLDIEIDPKKIPEIMRFFKDLCGLGSKKCMEAIPQEYSDEIRGIVDACKKIDPDTKTNVNDLLVLNTGFDVLLSKFYAVNNIWETHENVPFTPEDIRLPVMCNAFSVFGKATANGKHYFGRDFMFPTAKVYQDYACLTIYNPTDGRLPLISQAAPGFFGAMAAMNIEGVAMGVDMVPGGNCQPFEPGMNSLPMVRHTIHMGGSAQQALDSVIASDRGVSWLYMIADGKNDRSLAVECGADFSEMDFPKYVPEELKDLAPDQAFIDRYETQKHQKGVMARWNDYVQPIEFLQFNAGLFAKHGKKHDSKSWGEIGFLNKNFIEENCPSAYYFPPQRETREDVLVMTNHYIVPSIRMCSMNWTTALISAYKQNEIQWRYDELNKEILLAYGTIDLTKAKQLIDFLNPDVGQFPDYYADSDKSSDGKTTVVEGSVNLCNLSDKIFHSRFGYYADEWVTLTLPNYVE